MADRPAIPVEIQRFLRREAWFGCCKCGGPFFEYHHILGYANTGHDAAQMMILCPGCHYLATVGALDEVEQRKLKSLSYNRRNGYVRGLLWTKRDVLLIEAGQNVLVGAGYKLTVDGTVLFALRYGERDELLLTMSAYDNAGRMALSIVDNEWLLGADTLTDFVAKPQRLRLESPYLPLPLTIDARGDLILINGCLHFANRGWDIGPEMLVAHGFKVAFRGMGFFDFGFDFQQDGSLRIGNLAGSDFGAGAMVTLPPTPDRRTRTRQIIQQYRSWKSGTRKDPASRGDAG